MGDVRRNEVTESSAIEAPRTEADTTGETPDIVHRKHGSQGVGRNARIWRAVSQWNEAHSRLKSSLGKYDVPP